MPFLDYTLCVFLTEEREFWSLDCESPKYFQFHELFHLNVSIDKYESLALLETLLEDVDQLLKENGNFLRLKNYNLEQTKDQYFPLSFSKLIIKGKIEVKSYHFYTQLQREFSILIRFNTLVELAQKGKGNGKSTFPDIECSHKGNILNLSLKINDAA